MFDQIIEKIEQAIDFLNKTIKKFIAPFLTTIFAIMNLYSLTGDSFKKSTIVFKIFMIITIIYCGFALFFSIYSLIKDK